MPANQTTEATTAAYQDRMAALADRTALIVERAARILEDAPTGNLQAGFRLFVPMVVETTAAGQAQAQAIAAGYIRAAAELETGRPLEGPRLRIAGRTPYGSTLEEAFGSSPARAFMALQQGRQLPEAIALARTTAARIAHTEVFDAARLQVTETMRRTHRIRGWRWRTRGTCSACLGREDGAILPIGATLNVHPNCQCVQEPVFEGIRERVKPETATERFVGATREGQDAMLGPERAQLVRDGKASIPDFAATVPGPGGPVTDEVPIAAATEGPRGSRPRRRR